MASFAAKSGISIIWHFIEVLLSKGVHIITTLLLAWFLVPEDYALVAMLALFIAFSNVIVDAGFSQALLRQKDVCAVQLSTAFSVSLAIAVVVYGIFFISAPFVAEFYAAPELVELLRVVSLTLFFHALSLVPKVLLQRELAFKGQLQVMLPATLVAAVMSLIAAYWGLGVWALIIQIVVQAAIACVLFYVKQPWQITSNHLTTSTMTVGSSPPAKGAASLWIKRLRSCRPTAGAGGFSAMHRKPPTASSPGTISKRM